MIKENIINLNIYGKSTEVVVIDLHGHILGDIKYELPALIRDYYLSGYHFFKLIHGFQRGTILRNYVYNNLSDDLKKKKVICKVEKQSKGDTLIIIK